MLVTPAAEQPSRRAQAWLTYNVGQKMTSPYSEYRATKTWRILSRAIGDLESNRDFILQTKKEYVVGYLASKLAASVSKKKNKLKPVSRRGKKKK
ncbi:MAG: hypothetical protein QM715_01270 [Nibricoccus sp.]